MHRPGRVGNAADQLIQELPFRWSVQGRIFLIGGLAYMFDAWDVLLPAYLFPLLGRSAWHLNPTQLGWLGTSGLIGMALGAFVWGTLADIVGQAAGSSVDTVELQRLLDPQCPLANLLGAPDRALHHGHRLGRVHSRGLFAGRRVHAARSAGE